MSEYIEVGQPLQFTDPNTPTRVGEIVENVSDIYNIPSPRLGMQVFVKSEKKSFVITKLKSKVIGGVDVPEAAVESFEPVGAKSITWNNDTDPSNMNDFVVAGVYDIKGEHTRMDDNLPVLNTGGGHSFNARLAVLDSSISGSGKDDDKCITQVMSFNNRLGQGEVYIRTGKGISLDNLTWENWSTLQRNVNVERVDSLDDLKDNGIYSGVWLKGHYNNYPLTFVCVVINDYLIGTAPRRVSQFVYGLSKFDGSVVYQSRVWDDSKGMWGDWEILNQKEIASMISAEIKKVTDGIDPNKIDSLKDIITWIEEHGGDVTAIYNAIQQNTAKINASIKYVDVSPNVGDVELDLEDNTGNITHVVFPEATTEKAGVMTAADKQKLDSLSPGGGGSYTLPVATDDILGGIKSNSTYGRVGDNPNGEEFAVNVGNDGRATTTIPVANNENYGVVMVDSSVDSDSMNPVSGKAVAEAIANIGGGSGGDITATPTEKVVEEIEPTLVSTAIRKTPQVLTDSEKEIARGNIGAVGHSDLNNAIAEAITNTLNTAV